MTRKTASSDAQSNAAASAGATLHASKDRPSPSSTTPDEGKRDGADAPAGVRAAWGLELGEMAAHLVRLERGPDGLRIQRRQRFTAAGLWQSGVLDAHLLQGLKQIPQDEPLGICFPDHAMLCRGFCLPRADVAATDKMVAAQVESLLSVGPGRLVSTWHAWADPSNPKMQWVVFCAVRRELLEQLKTALPPGVPLRALLPRAIAAAHGCPAAATPSSSQLIIELTDNAATMALVAGGRLMRCLMLDGDPEEQMSPDDSPTAPPWVRQARQSCQSLLEGLPRERWPKEGLVRGTNGEAAALLPQLRESLGLDLSLWPTSHDTATDEMAGRSCAAVATARMLLADSSAMSINFVRPEEPAVGPAVAIRPRRVLALGVSCLAGILLLYGIDCYRGWWLARQIEQVQAVETASGGLETRLAIDRYLQKNASPALPGLDAILAAAPSSLSMTSFGMSATGQFRFVGAVGSPGELDEFLRKLQASRALMNVEVRSVRNEQNRWLIELSADATPAAGLLLVTAPKPAAAAPSSPPQAGPSAPAPQAPGGGAVAASPAASAKGPATTFPSTTAPATTAPATQPAQRGGK